MPDLKTILEKFDAVSKNFESGEDIVLHLGGAVSKYAEEDEPFEYFYNSICGDAVLGTIGDLLIELRIVPLSKEDLKFYYENTRNNFQK